MDGYFCAFQESQGGATTGKSWLSPGKWRQHTNRKIIRRCSEWRKMTMSRWYLDFFIHFQRLTSAVASMRPTEALASVKFWRISPIIFILHIKRSSDIFNASWYYKEFSNSVNILWKNYHIIDLKGLRTLTQMFFEQILIKTIGEINGHPDYVACFWLLLFKFHLN